MNFDDAFRPMEDLVQAAIRIAPRVALVLLVLIFGVLFASIIGRMARWFVRRSGLETLCEKIGVTKALYALGIKNGVARMLGTIVWASVLLLTFSSAASLLGLPGVAQIASTAVAVLPRFLIAGIIAAGGLVAADFVRNIVRRASSSSDEVDSPEVVAHLAYYAIVVIALTTALEQAGIATSLINNLVLIVVSAMGIALAASFAVSSRVAFQNVIARHYVRKIIRPGDRIAWEGIEGEVMKYGAASVLVRTESNEVLIPCRRLLDESVVLERRR